MTNILNDLLNIDSLEDAKKGKVVYIDIDKITPNPLNTALIGDLSLLEKNIEEGGLMQPLLIIKKENKNVIHTGHRRFEALKSLREKNIGYQYMGKRYLDEIPCIYIGEVYSDDVEERISMMRSNCYRNNLNVEDKKKLILEASECYEYMKNKNQTPKGRKREWIASVTGISERTIQNILTDEKTENITCEDSDDCGKLPQEEIDEPSLAIQEIKKTIKTMKKLSQQLENLDVDMNVVDMKHRNEFTKGILSLMDQLLKNQSH